LHEQEKLELGGPFLLLDPGGMMVAAKEVPQEELEVGAAQTWLCDQACSLMKSAYG